MGKLQTFLPSLPYVAGGFLSYQMPEDNIKRIIIKENVGALSGGATGTKVSNTSIEYIQIRIRNKVAIEWNGQDEIAGQMSMGILALRELYFQIHRKAMPNDHFIIELPETLPPSAKIQIRAKMGTLASIQTAGGDRTTYDGTFDIQYEGEDKAKSNPLVPYITFGAWNHLARTGQIVEFLDSMPFPLRTLIIITDDSNVLANDVYDTLRIMQNRDQIWEGSFADLKNEQEGKTFTDLATGVFMKSWKQGWKIPANTIRLVLNASVPGTSKNIRYVAICY